MSRKKSVLIFEDDIDLASQWLDTLSKKGINACHALSVDEAIGYCSQQKFDAVVLDIFLADNQGKLLPRGGITLMSYLRNPSLEKIPQWGATVPVLVVSGAIANMGFDPVLNAKAMGGSHHVDVLRKPFQPELLYDKLMELIAMKDQ